jgi:hypothetical protein
MCLATAARAAGSPVQAAFIGVTVAPGATAFTRVPRPANSSVRARIV